MRHLVIATQSKYNKEMCLKPEVNTFLIPKVNCPQTLKQPVFRHFKTLCGWILPLCGDFTLRGHAQAWEIDSFRGVEELFLYFALCSAVYYRFGFLFLPAECWPPSTAAVSATPLQNNCALPLNDIARPLLCSGNFPTSASLRAVRRARPCLSSLQTPTDKRG